MEHQERENMALELRRMRTERSLDSTAAEVISDAVRAVSVL